MPKLQRSTSIAVWLCAAVLAGCAKKDNAAVDTTGDTTAVTTAPTPAPVNLADVAGKWNVRAVPASGTDTTPTNSVLTATSTTSGWTITFPGRQPVPMRITVDADSIMSDAGPYPSVRRKGVQVTTNGVMRLEGGNLVGRTTAHFRVKTPDSVLVLTTTGTRAP
ncbi:MAG: hypothetical protein H7210_02045 [Pyrinomonadaceae bacterium]|nr:hypothetical protein [Phycisphaerales bacterium]